MNFEKNRKLGVFGNVLGFLFSYLLFTTMLFLIISILNKLPVQNSIFYVIKITLIIIIIGLVLEKLLK